MVIVIVLSARDHTDVDRLSGRECNQRSVRLQYRRTRALKKFALTEFASSTRRATRAPPKKTRAEARVA